MNQTKAAGGVSGFLVVVRRTVSDQPIGLFGTRRQARDYARAVTTTGTDDGPRKGRGELGPPGVVSRAVGVGIVPFAGGVPGASERFARRAYAAF